MSGRRSHSKLRWLLSLGGVAALCGASFTLGLATRFLPASVQTTLAKVHLRRISVETVDPEGPARAAVEWFVPSLSGNAKFERLVAKALVENRSRGMAERARETRRELAFLRRELAAQGLPDVWLGIPYMESRMHPETISPQCAGGAWQFLAGTARREGLRVGQCEAPSDESEVDAAESESDPEEEIRAARTSGRGCRRSRCAIDERLDFEKSSLAALRHLRRLTQQPGIDGSPDRVPLGILAFNMGIGGAQRVLAAANGREPFRFVATCTSRSCEAMREESAWYVPRVVATAALVACNGADAAVPELSDWVRSGLCSALHEAQLGPATVGAAEALAAVAREHPGGWKVGLAALRPENDTLTADARRLDAWLLRALSGVPGVHGIPGVPEESAEELMDQGAKEVVTGTVGGSGPIGQSGRQLWVRLERWDRAKNALAEVAFAAIDPSALDPMVAENLLADALLRPVRDRSDEAIRSIVHANADRLRECLPPVVSHRDDPALALTLRLDDAARVAGVDVRGERPSEAQRRCAQDKLSPLRFPHELAGGEATLEVTIGAPGAAVAMDEPQRTGVR